MRELEKKIELVDRKLKKLISCYQEQKQNYLKLKNEQLQLQEQLAKKINETNNLRNKEKIAKIVLSISENPQKVTELKLLINEQLREIDKCIAYLNQ